MVGKTPAAPREYQVRMSTIVEYGGCVCCLAMGWPNVQATIEHVTDRGRRKGAGGEQHRWTIGLCEWHHFGRPTQGRNRKQMVEAVGPSLAHGRIRFEEYFGTEELLVEVQDAILLAWNYSQWPSHDMPFRVANDMRHLWMGLNKE